MPQREIKNFPSRLRSLRKSMDVRTEATRTLLIATALDMLTEEGGYGLTSRKIAQRANVNHALITYHFKGISGLLDAVFEDCVGRLSQVMQPHLTWFEEELSLTPDDLLPDFIRRQTSLLLTVFAGAQTRDLLNILSSPQARYVGSYQMLQQRMLLPLHQAFCSLVARARKIPRDSLESGVLAHLVLTQIMAFFRGGYPVARHMQWESIPQEAEPVIHALVAESIRRIVEPPEGA